MPSRWTDREGVNIVRIVRALREGQDHQVVIALVEDGLSRAELAPVGGLHHLRKLVEGDGAAERLLRLGRVGRDAREAPPGPGGCFDQ